MSKAGSFTAELPKGVESFKHSAVAYRALEARIRRAMHYAGYKDFSAFALAAFATQCRKIEQEHGLPPDVDIVDAK